MNEKTQKKTNILLIQVDQMPWFCLSKLKNKNVNTPNLDRLINQGGVLFKNTTAQSPICLPSRISMLSGQYVSSTKQFGFTGYCERGIDWMQNVLKDAGYTTGGFGKFHVVSMGDDAWGFDVCAPTLPEEIPFSKPKGNNYREYCKQNNIPWPTDQMHGHDPFNGIKRRSSHVKEEMVEMEKRACKSDIPTEHSLEIWTTNKCIDFVKDCHKSEKPFFTWLSFHRPHIPTSLSEEWFARIKPDEIELFGLPDAEALTGLPRYMFDIFSEGTSLFNIKEKTFRFILASYYTLIECIDSEIGRVMDTLEELGLDKNTTVIFTADHGDDAGYNGLFNKKRKSPSEAITRVPFIIRPAQGVLSEELSGTVVTEPVELVDIFPTICSLSNIEIPQKVEGRDLSGFLKGKEKLDPSRPVFCEEYYRRMIKKDGYKLIFDMDSEKDCLLYDMNKDPNQFRNLYNREEFIEKRIELKKELLSFLSQRIHGLYTDFDVERVKRGLDPKDDMLPLHAACQDSRIVLHFFRAGVSIRADHSHEVFVPFYEDAPILLFGSSGKHHLDTYRTSDQAIEFDPKIVEEYLNTAIRHCMKGITPVSVITKRWPIDDPVSTREEAEELILKSKELMNGE